MRILVATDAWHPQVNGVVRTLTTTADSARALGAEVSFLTPESFRTFAMPSYRDLRLALPRPGKVARLIAEARPDAIHIATEGPIGLSVRRYCRRHDLPFTTSFHTRFPEYVSARAPIPESWVWASLRWFHGTSEAVMAATPALAAELRARGFRNVVLWPRGVDASLFRPRDVDLCLPKPVFLCVGRVAVEKNLEAFLGLDLPGTGRRWSRVIRTRCSWARCRASGWRRSMRPPTCSCFRAGPTRSASFCWRRSQADFRWRLSR
jgi:glycosyltransferase involved in cell wall biosynthesis